jgi:hypothetical protein
MSKHNPRLQDLLRRFRGSVHLISSFAVLGFLVWQTAAADPKALKKLPVIPKPDPAQPAVGLSTDKHLDKSPVRKTKGLDLVRLGWSHNCMDCHRLFPAQWARKEFVEHKSVKLAHGANRFCLNCHHATNRNAFTDYDGSEIAEKNVVQLCGRCHGPAHRDWKAGVHGRRNGFWDKARGKQTQLRCIQCHDPHQPKFPPLKAKQAPTYPARAAGKGNKHP